MIGVFKVMSVKNRSRKSRGTESVAERSVNAWSRGDCSAGSHRSLTATSAHP